MVQRCPSSITSLTTSNVKQISGTVLGWFVKNPWRKETSPLWECLTVRMFLKSADFLAFFTLFGTSIFNLESCCNIEYTLSLYTLFHIHLCIFLSYVITFLLGRTLTVTISVLLKFKLFLCMGSIDLLHFANSSLLSVFPFIWIST